MGLGIARDRKHCCVHQIDCSSRLFNSFRTYIRIGSHIYTHHFQNAKVQDKKSLSCFQVVSSRGALEHADSSASEGSHDETKSVPEHDAKTDCKAKRKTA